MRHPRNLGKSFSIIRILLSNLPTAAALELLLSRVGSAGVADKETAKAYAPIVVGWNEVDNNTGNGGSNTGGSAESQVTTYMAYIKEARSRGFTEFITPSLAGALPQRFVDNNSGAAQETGEWLPAFLDACCEKPDCITAFR